MNRISEKEALVNNSLQLFKLEQFYNSNPEAFQDATNYFSFFVHINKRKSNHNSSQNLNWVWGNDLSVEAVGEAKSEEVQYSKILELSDNEVYQNYVQIIDQYERRNDSLATCSFFQKMKLFDDWRWIITNKKIINDDNYLNVSYSVKDLQVVGKYIQDILDNTFDDIYAWQKFQSLTKTEKEILKLIANGKSNKEVAEIRCLSLGTVRKHRENITRKTDLRDLHSLIRFADAFGLVGAL